jgi:hypothetical protein
MAETETLPARIEHPHLVRPVVPDEMSVDQVVEQVRKIQQVQAKVMKQGEHYGVIPGTQKPTLLKPGAEKLALTFRLDPQYEILESLHKDGLNGLIRYVVRCTLWHIPSGNRIASGVGSCNSHENRYRYRWRIKAKPSQEEIEAKKANGTGRFIFDSKRKRSDWHERLENDNPDDLDNTLVKMACKRALVAAVLNGTAASDIFTQDLEDLQPEGEPPAAPTDDKPITVAQRKDLWLRAQQYDWSPISSPEEGLRHLIAEVKGVEPDAVELAKVTRGELTEIAARMGRYPKLAQEASKAPKDA